MSELDVSELDSALQILSQRVKITEQLYLFCSKFPSVSGITKLQKQIKAELNFLQKLNSRPKNIKINQLKSSNLPHLAAIVDCISHSNGVTKLLTPFLYSKTSLLEPKRIIVDVVADYGKTWIKVVARNPDALLLLSKGDGKFGEKSLIEQVKELTNCAKQNEYMFLPPKVKLAVIKNIDVELFSLLNEMDIEVFCLNEVKVCRESNEGNISFSLELKQTQYPKNEKNIDTAQSISRIIDSSFNTEKMNSDSDLPLSVISRDMVLNLDVSCLLAYIANMTNGFSHIKLKDKILNEQAERESVSSVKQHLDELFEGHKLICCKSAYSRFVDIFTKVGGKAEKQRASEIISRLIIVDDNPSTKSMQLQEIGRINKNSVIIFGTGDSLKAVTVTANAGFVRAAESQGHKFAVHIHESRALSELKEI